MPESMFGRPLQHLLPSEPQVSEEDSSETSDLRSVPVQPAPLPFKEFRFNLIGKQPELLGRISHRQPDSVDYHSSTPSPTSTPPPTSTNDLQSKSSSRPTLLQQLAGHDISSMDRGSRRNPSTNQFNCSLASRIQMSGSPSNDITSVHTASEFPTPLLPVSTAVRVTKSDSLIPPVEVLPQPSDSSPPTPASWAPTIEPDIRSLAYSTPFVNTTTIATSRDPTPAVTVGTASKGPAEAFPSLAVADVMMRDAQPLPSMTTAIDSLVTRQKRLQSVSTKLANLAPPISPPLLQSPPPDTSSVTAASADIIPNQPCQSRYSSTPTILHHPYSADPSFGLLGSSINDAQTHTNDSSSAPVPSPMTLTQEFQTEDRAIAAAVQNLNSVLDAAYRIQVENQNALALRIRTFEEQRAASEQTKREEEARLQRELRELQQKREELDAKEVMLASLEKENKAREEARRDVLAKRQAQEEEKRVAEVKRVQEVQEQIEAFMNELKEIEALKAKCQVEQLVTETVQNDLPTGPQESMNEEERAVIKSRNDLLCAVKHLRRMHTDKVQKLEETNRTLRRLGAERKHREAEEAAHRRAEEEEPLLTHAQLEQARQLPEEKRRQSEVERKRQEAEKDREQARPLVEQQAHPEAQAHRLGRTEATSGRVFEHPSCPEEVSASQQQEIGDTTTIRAARKENRLSPQTTNVDEDRRASALPHNVPSSDIHPSPGTPQPKQKKKDKPISGGVMLAASTPKANLPPKSLTIPPSFPSSDHAVENASNLASISSAFPASVEGTYRSSLPAQLASGFNHAVSAGIRATPDYKPAFSRTPKSQTVLDATNGGSQELNIGPVAGVSPTQQNVNLRHLKRFRGHAEGNDSSDRSVRTIQVKIEENSYLPPKEEKQDDQARRVAQSSLWTNLPASLPPRPAIIPPPRPRMSGKRPEVSAFQTETSNSCPHESSKMSLIRKEAESTADEQPQEALPQDTPSFQAEHVPVRLPAPSETTNSLLRGLMYAEPQASEPRINAGEKPAQYRSENYDTTASEPPSATSSHEYDGEELSRSNRRFTDEHHRARNANGSRRVSNHYSPPSTSPTLELRLIDPWRPQNSSNGPRAEPMCSISPIAGKKRPSEFNDNEHGRRARRRDDGWKTQDHDHDRVDSYRPHWDRRLDPGPDERRAVYRPPTSALDRNRPYPSDVPRAPCDNRTHLPQEPTAPAARREQSYKRTEDDNTYQRYPPSAPAYSAIADQHHTDGGRIGQTYEPMAEERMDAESDPSLLARIGDAQCFPPRGRGRGEPTRGRGDFGRGRGRGVARGGTPLIERLTTVPSGPSSLGDRLS